MISKENYFHRIIELITAFLTVVLIGSCSHSEIEQKIDAKMKSMPPIGASAELQADIEQDIEKSSLGDEQKHKLLELSERVSKETDRLREESRRLRAILAQDITKPSYDRDEVAALRGRLKEIEDKRLSVIFASVDDANSLLGNDSDEHRAILSHLLEPLSRWDTPVHRM